MSDFLRPNVARWAVLPTARNGDGSRGWQDCPPRVSRPPLPWGAAWVGLALLLLAAAARGDGSGWRGDGTGCFPQTTPPLQWDIDEGKNILWKADIGKGQSTPVVAGGRIFVTVEQDFLLALDPKSGKILWKKDNSPATLPSGAKVPEKRPPTAPNCGYATPTPVADGKFIWASYGTGIVVCYDLEGNRQWARHLDLPQASEFGRSASPVLAGGKLLVSIGGMEALDPKTGEVLWQAPDAKPTFGTPAVAKIGETDVAITPGGNCVRVSDGKILASKLGAMVYVSPIVHAGVVYYIDKAAAAWRLPAQAGDAPRFEKVWENEDLEGEFFACPVWHDGLIYAASNEGIFYVLDAATGKLVYKKELGIRSAGGKPGMEPANVYPSITLAGKHLLVGNDAGETLVLVPGREYREAARNFLDKGCGASPAVDGGLLFLRGAKKLYCIGQK